MKKNKKSPAAGMILEQRDMNFHNEFGEWLRKHPSATPEEIDEANRRLTKKWRV